MFIVIIFVHFFFDNFVCPLIVVRDNNLRSGYGDLGLALDIDMVFEMAYESKPNECFHA
jgi:hypothetical protein